MFSFSASLSNERIHLIRLAELKPMICTSHPETRGESRCQVGFPSEKYNFTHRRFATLSALRSRESPRRLTACNRSFAYEETRDSTLLIITTDAPDLSPIVPVGLHSDKSSTENEEMRKKIRRERRARDREECVRIRRDRYLEVGRRRPKLTFRAPRT